MPSPEAPPYKLPASILPGFGALNRTTFILNRAFFLLELCAGKNPPSCQPFDWPNDANEFFAIGVDHIEVEPVQSQARLSSSFQSLIEGNFLHWFAMCIEDIFRVNAALAQVARTDKIDHLSLSRDGTAAIQYAGNVQVCFEYISETRRLYLYAAITSFPEDTEERLALFEKLLTCNFLHIGSAGGDLAVLPLTRQTMYQIWLDAGLITAVQLNDAINSLLDKRHQLVTELTNPSKSNAASNTVGGKANMERRLRKLVET